MLHTALKHACAGCAGMAVRGQRLGRACDAEQLRLRAKPMPELAVQLAAHSSEACGPGRMHGCVCVCVWCGVCLR